MKMDWNWQCCAILLLLVFSAVACADSQDEDFDIATTGLEDGKYLNELDAEEIETVCRWQARVVELADGAGSCESDSDGAEVSDELSTCSESPIFSSHCKLDDFEACMRTAKDDPCEFHEGAACAAISDCVMGEDPDTPPANWTVCSTERLVCWCTGRYIDEYYRERNRTVEHIIDNIPTCFEWTSLFCKNCDRDSVIVEKCEKSLLSSDDNWLTADCDQFWTERY